MAFSVVPSSAGHCSEITHRRLQSYICSLGPGGGRMAVCKEKGLEEGLTSCGALGRGCGLSASVSPSVKWEE